MTTDDAPDEILEMEGGCYWLWRGLPGWYDGSAGTLEYWWTPWHAEGIDPEPSL